MVQPGSDPPNDPDKVVDPQVLRGMRAARDDAEDEHRSRLAARLAEAERELAELRQASLAEQLRAAEVESSVARATRDAQLELVRLRRDLEEAQARNVALKAQLEHAESRQPAIPKAVEAELQALRQVAEELERSLTAERAARLAAEKAVHEATVAREELSRMLAGAHARLADAHERIAEMHRHAETARRELERIGGSSRWSAAGEMAEQLRGLVESGEALPSHPALRSAGPAEAPPEDLLGALDRAAERLRAEEPVAEPEPEPELEVAPEPEVEAEPTEPDVAPEPEAADELELEVEEVDEAQLEAIEAAVVEHVALEPEPGPEPAAADEPEPEPEPEVSTVGPREPAAVVKPWLTDAARALAAADPAAVPRLLRAYEPLLSERLGRDLVLEAAVEGQPAVQLTLGPGRKRRGPARLAGPPERFAPLLGGGKRLRGLDKQARPLALRRLRKAMRAPVGLEELARAGARPAAADLAALLAAAIDPQKTIGHEFIVGLRDGSSAAAIGVDHGEPLRAMRSIPSDADAVLEADAGQLLAVIAGLSRGLVRGEREAVERLLSWIDGSSFPR